LLGTKSRECREIREYQQHKSQRRERIKRKVLARRKRETVSKAA
jgi:hypothetical protein